ncbi:MAG: DUF2752 domain-containing protein [Sandaracinaceae bacterium]|nr:DUF2752 domain-containing protein [Sandaracinaceae bacterium]MDW8246866.1 DUF2752 domain-containing protein [Sandaracinaceae bacterium]
MRERSSSLEALRALVESPLFSRLVWLLLFFGSGGVLLTASLLTPDPRGYGTHTQLGLPPCAFFVLTGFPCPSCGMTTGFAHLMRLNLAGAWRANPASIPVFAMTWVVLFTSGIGAFRGWCFWHTLEKWRWEWWGIGMIAFLIANWLVRIGVMATSSP